MSLMQRRHYEFLADEVAPLMGWPSTIYLMADKLASTNPNFNKEKFIERSCPMGVEASSGGDR